jgi:hypothetical protein
MAKWLDHAHWPYPEARPDRRPCKQAGGFRPWTTRHIGDQANPRRVPVAAGIVGTRKFFHDVCDDAMNTASRMETIGPLGEIQASQRAMNCWSPPSTFKSAASRLAGAVSHRHKAQDRQVRWIDGNHFNFSLQASGLVSGRVLGPAQELRGRTPAGLGNRPPRDGIDHNWGRIDATRQ